MNKIKGIYNQTRFGQPASVMVIQEGTRPLLKPNPHFGWVQRKDVDDIEHLLGNAFIGSSRLEGSNPLNTIAYVRDAEALRAIKKKGYPIQSIYRDVDRYLVQSGELMYQNYEPLRLCFDIEVFQTTDAFPDGSVPGDEIFIIAMKDSTGWERVIHKGDYPDERDLITEFIKEIRRRDPDTIEGHNVYNFDLPYVNRRCDMHKLPFPLGRDNRAPRFRPRKIKYADRPLHFLEPTVGGRSVLDTMHMAYRWDATFRELPGYGLKAVAKHLGVAEDEREMIVGSKIGTEWDRDPERVLRYALHDVRETMALSDIFSTSDIFLVRETPTDQQGVLLSGMATQINLTFLQEYFQEGHSIPIAKDKTGYIGGFTDLRYTGVKKNLLYADVASLYPSIMLLCDVKPKGDELDLFQRKLRYFTAVRFKTKDAMNRERDPAARQRLSAQQNAYKIRINSFYGSLGTGGVSFNDMEQATFVTEEGRDLVKMLVSKITDRGGDVVEVDTDGVLFVRPDGVGYPGEEGAFDLVDEDLIKMLSDDMPEGINIDMDGRYKAGLFFGRKTYVLQKYNGHLTIKGAGLKSRGMCKLQLRLIKKLIRYALAEDESSMKKLFDSCISDLRRGIFEIDDLVFEGKLKKSLEDYDKSESPKSAVYEVARRLGKTRAGETVQYYIGGSNSVSRISNWRDATAFNPELDQKSDVNVLYYMKMVEKVFDRFKMITDFPKINYRGLEPNPNTNQKELCLT